MRRLIWPLALLAIIGAAYVAWAAAPGVINSYVGVCDPNFATHCAAPDSSGNLPVNVISGGGSPAITCNASSSAPTYSAGQNPCSQDLSGNLRVAVPSSQLVPATAAGTPAATGPGVQGLGTSGIPLNIAGNAGGALDAATGASVPANAVQGGCRAANAEPTADTNGQLVGHECDLVGKTVTSPWANKENWGQCANNTTGTGATTCTGMAATASLHWYITSAQCFRTDAGTTAIIVTFNDAATSIFAIPDNGGGGGFTETFGTPLVIAINTAPTFTFGSGVTTGYCSMQGYKGT